MESLSIIAIQIKIVINLYCKMLPKLLYYSSKDKLWYRKYLRVSYLRAYIAKERKEKEYKSNSNYRWDQLNGTRHL